MVLVVLLLMVARALLLGWVMMAKVLPKVRVDALVLMVLIGRC